VPFRFATFGVAAALLSGCAGLAPSRLRYAYFVVPCETPGSIRTGSKVGQGERALSQAAEIDVPNAGAGARADPDAAVCVVAARQASAYAGPAILLLTTLGTETSHYYSVGVGYRGGGHRLIHGGGHGGGAHGRGHQGH